MRLSVEVKRFFVDDSVLIGVDNLLGAGGAAFLLAVEVSNGLGFVAGVCRVFGPEGQGAQLAQHSFY